MTQGVMYDTAQTWYQIDLAYQLGDGTPRLHLYSSDDTPTPSVSPFSYAELSNDSYAPLPVPNGYWQFFGSSTPSFYAVLGAQWELAGPAIGQDSIIYGWFMGALSTRLATEVPLFGGRFQTPVSIPPAGLTLTLAEVQLPLHDCATAPPAPPATSSLLIDLFTAAVATALPSHQMDLGGPWTQLATVHTLNAASGKAVATTNADCSDYADAGQANVVLTVNYTHAANTGPSVLFRLQDSTNFWFLDWIAGNWSVNVRVAGVDTNHGSAAFTLVAGTTYSLALVVWGSGATLCVNGVEVLDFGAMAQFLTQTKVGLYLIATSGTLPAGTFDTFRVSQF